MPAMQFLHGASSLTKGHLTGVTAAMGPDLAIPQRGGGREARSPGFSSCLRYLNGSQTGLHLGVSTPSPGSCADPGLIRAE